MEGRVDLNSLERSRMLSQLTSADRQMTTESERSRGVSPSTRHFLPSAASLHPTGSSYAMMAGYLAGHVPDSLKHLLPEMQQYWSAAAHSEGVSSKMILKFLISQENHMFVHDKGDVHEANTWRSFLHDNLDFFIADTVLERLSVFFSIANRLSHSLLNDIIEKSKMPHITQSPNYCINISMIFCELDSIDVRFIFRFSFKSYSRYLLESMYGSYLPYMPATESLALFAHNSAQLEATLQAHAVHHRIYDLQKDALASQGVYPPSLYQYPHLYPSAGGQLEATNLSLPGSSRSKQGDKREDDVRNDKRDDKRLEDKRLDDKRDRGDRETRTRAESDDRKGTKPLDQCLDFSKQSDIGCDRKRGKGSKTDDVDKIKSSSKLNQSSLGAFKSHTESGSRDLVCTDRRRHLSDNSLKRDLFAISKSESPSHVKASLHSPPVRHKLESSPDRSQSKSSDRKDASRSPYGFVSKTINEQDMPENLCIKDKQKDRKGNKETKADKKESGIVKTQTVDTATTVTVTATLNIITSDISSKDKSFRRKASSVSPQSQKSPSMSQTNTTTTYSLPYYHNLFSRTQTPDNKRVHATTYIPEIGTVSSPVAGGPGIIQVKETKSSRSDKPAKLKYEDKDTDAKEVVEEKVKDGSDKSDKAKDKGDVKTVLDVPQTASKRSDSTDSDINIDVINVDTTNEVKDEKCDNKAQTSNNKDDKNSSKTENGVKGDTKKHGETTKENDSENDDSPVINQKEAVHSKTKVDEKNNSDKIIKVSKNKEKTVTNKKSNEVTNSTDTSRTERNRHKKKMMDVPLTILDMSDVISVADLEDKEKYKYKGKETEEKKTNGKADVKSKKDDDQSQKTTLTPKQTTIVRPIPVTKSPPENELKSVSSKGKTADIRHPDRETQPTGIPIGIAVARQRNIAPKVTSDKEGNKKSTDDTSKPKNPVADVKPIRPLKVIRPSTKGATSSPKVDKRNELPANLIVTGGSPHSGVFWSEDQSAGRHLAPQFHPVPPTSWFGQNAFPIATTISTNTTGNTGNNANQLPVNVPAQTPYKLAQNPLTGQLVLLSSGTELFDSTRMFGGLPMANTVNPGSPFGPATFVTGGTSAAPQSLVTQTPIYHNHTTLSDRPANVDINVQPFMPIFGPNILPDDKVNGITTQNAASGAGTEVSIQSTVDKPVITPQQPLIQTDGGVAAGCEISPFAFSTPTVPVVFNPTIIPPPPQTVTDHTPSVTADHHINPEIASVQSRGTSPMLPASDSCPEDLKSDDNVDDAVDICEENQSEKSEHTNEKQAEVNVDVETVTSNVNESEDMSVITSKSNSKVDKDDLTVKVEDEIKSEHPADSEEVSSKQNRNIFKDLTDYNPFMDPQVLQAADGLELLSALAEKTAPAVSDSKEGDQAEIKLEDKHVISETKTETKPSDKKIKTQVRPKQLVKDSEKKVKVKTKEETPTKKKSRVKFGYSFKSKMEPKQEIVPEKKMTTFCGITIPEDDDVIDSIETEMKMRLAELQKRYKEKQKQLAKLTPKKAKDTEKETDKQKQTGEAPRGPGRPKKRLRDPNATDTTSPTATKSKKTEPISRTSPTGSTSSTNGSSHHGHQSKRKNMAEMIVDRVFRKTASSFKIPLSKKVNLIAPARMEFPGAPNVHEKARHKKSLDLKKLIKRSRLSQINGKEGSFAGVVGLWNKRMNERRQFLNAEAKSSAKKKTDDKPAVKESPKSSDSGLGLLAEYAEKSRDETTKKKRTSDEASLSLSPDSPNKKRKPGRPRKCDVVQPGVTETIVAKQSKHIDFFRWQSDSEPKQERKISLEGKTPLKPLYLDEWNVRRSERIFLNDPSPQTSPNTASPAPKSKAVSPGTKVSPGSKVKSVSPGSKTSTSPVKSKPFSTTKSEKTRLEKPKKSQSLNMSMKVKKKYSSNFNQQQKSRERTTELLKATRDRLTQSRLEKKNKLASTIVPSATVKTSRQDSSGSDDLPLSSLIKPKPTALPDCALHQDKLEDGMRILVFMDGLFHEGELKAIRPPDIYGAVLDNERKTRPHYYSLEEILKEAIKDTKPDCPEQLKEGTRICAYWSQQFSCLYPGTISKGNPDDDDTNDKDLFNVDFDDSDTGKIPLDHIRIIPQDFPHVEYDPNPLLLLTKRRRTTSISESGEPRKSQSEITPKKPQPETSKDAMKLKRGPGRPPKTDRMVSVESVGDDEVFKTDSSKAEGKKSKADKGDDEVVFVEPRELWQWSGSSTKRPGMKGKARKEFYRTIFRHKEHISVGDCAVFISTGRPNLPYVGHIESFWETWSGQMVVKVKWFYHPEETKGGKRLQKMKGALFRSDHEDENDVQTISHKCEVIPYSEYRRRVDIISHDNNDDVYYLAGAYEPTIGHIKFEPGVL